MKRKLYTAIVFDLDDTLIDTTQYLVRPAMEKSFAKLIGLGVLSNPSDGHNFQKENPALADKIHFFTELIRQKRPELSEPQRDRLRDEVLAVYFGEPETGAIRTFPDAPEILSALTADYDLYLVSLGNPEIQEKKVAITGLAHFFRHSWFPDFRKHHDKEITLRTMLEVTRVSPERVLCIGNRIDHEIMNAKALGMKTCWMEYGEHLNRRPLLHHETPDFTIPSLKELIHTCQL